MEEAKEGAPKNEERTHGVIVPEDLQRGNVDSPCGREVGADHAGPRRSDRMGARLPG
jgi:hypothetical protein